MKKTEEDARKGVIPLTAAEANAVVGGAGILDLLAGAIVAVGVQAFYEMGKAEGKAARARLRIC